MDSETKRATGVWIVLMVLSVVTYAAPAFGLTAGALVLLTLGIAIGKAHLVADYFMGLSQVSGIWRPIMVIYLGSVGAAIAAAFMM